MLKLYSKTLFHISFILLILTFASKYNLSHIPRNIFGHLLYHLYILYAPGTSNLPVYFHSYSPLYLAFDLHCRESYFKG